MGAGVAGVELALAMDYRLRELVRRLQDRVCLIEAERPTILERSECRCATRKKLHQSELTRANIEILTGTPVTALTKEGGVILGSEVAMRW